MSPPEAQNLQKLVALREATAAEPGKRVLLMVGSSHKLLLDAYLHLLMDVGLVSAPAILSGTPPAAHMRRTWGVIGGA